MCFWGPKVSIVFVQPLWFILLPLLLLIKLLVRHYIERKNRFQYEISSIYHPLLNANNMKGVERTHTKPWLYYICIVAMVIALAQPAVSEKKFDSPDSVKDIVFIVDTSVGMAISDYTLNDVAVSRLTLLKAVLTDFVTKLSGNRIGMMVYADHAYTMVPLTRDRNLIAHNIQLIQPALAGRQSDLSNALNTVLKHFEFSSNKPSVVVLSQGSNIKGDVDPLVVAEKFKINGIKLHMIGLGSRTMPTASDSGLIFDSIDNKLLDRMATLTNGQFFWVGKSGSLDSILNEIVKSESIEIKANEYVLLENYFQYMLYLVVFLLFVSWLLSTFIKSRL